MRFLLAAALGMALWGQTDAPKAAGGRVIGEVAAADESGRLKVKADSGVVYAVSGGETTRYLRVPPGEKDLKNASRVSAGDVKVGDRVIARGPVDEEKKSLVATTLVVMTKEDLTQKNQREQEDWQRRSITAMVKATSPDLMVALRSRDGESTLTVATTAATKISRYAPESVHFHDAKPAQLSDIATGDVVRVLGNKSEDGSRIQAEHIVAGTFRTLGGTVVSADAAKNQVVVKDAESKQPVTIIVTPDTQLRKLSPMAANMLARRLNPTMQTAAQAAPPGGASGGGFQRGGPGGARGGGGIDQMLGNLPTFPLTELAAGEVIMVSTSARAGSPTAYAITILSGAEPVLRAAPAGSMNLGSWSMDLAMPAQ